MVEGILEVKFPTIWTDEKQSRAEAEGRERLEREDQRRERVRRKKMQMREKVGKSRNTMFFQWFEAPEGQKVGSLKRRVRSQLAKWEMKNCTPLWREAHFQVKMYKTPQRRTTFGSYDVEKVHAVLARSRFSSQNVQNTLVGPLLEVAMSKKCTPLWREAHFEVKMFKTLGVRTTFGGWDVEKVDALVARSTFQSENVQNTRASDHFWRFRSRFAFHTTLQYITLHYNYNYNYNYNYTSRHSTTLHSTTLHCAQLHSITLHYITLHYTPLHYITLHYITLHYPTLHYTTPPSTTLHYTTLHYTSLHYITLHSTTLHFTYAYNYTPLH